MQLLGLASSAASAVVLVAASLLVVVVVRTGGSNCADLRIARLEPYHPLHCPLTSSAAAAAPPPRPRPWPASPPRPACRWGWRQGRRGGARGSASRWGLPCCCCCCCYRLGPSLLGCGKGRRAAGRARVGGRERGRLLLFQLLLRPLPPPMQYTGGGRRGRPQAGSALRSKSCSSPCPSSYWYKWWYRAAPGRAACTAGKGGSVGVGCGWIASSVKGLAGCLVGLEVAGRTRLLLRLRLDHRPKIADDDARRLLCQCTRVVGYAFTSIHSFTSKSSPTHPPVPNHTGTEQPGTRSRAAGRDLDP